MQAWSAVKIMQLLMSFLAEPVVESCSSCKACAGQIFRGFSVFGPALVV